MVERNAGRAPLPPRTLVEQTTIIRNNKNVTVVTNVIGPTRTVVGDRGAKVVALDNATRARLRETTHTNQVAAAAERRKAETAPAGSAALTKTRTASLPATSTPHVGATTTSTANMDKGATKSGADTGKTATSDKGGSTLDRGTSRDTNVQDSKVTPKDRSRDTKKSNDSKKKG